MISTTDLRPGMVIELNGELLQVVKQQHVKPGKGPAFMRMTFRNLRTGATFDEKLRTGEKVKRVILDERPSQYLYRDGDKFVFMDEESFEQFALGEDQLGDIIKFLKESESISIASYEGSPVNITLPTFVELEVVKTEPDVRGDTASGGSKPATLETGAVVQVPFFVSEGDAVKVDTRTGEYVERVSG
jgi:elongation factor P